MTTTTLMLARILAGLLAGLYVGFVTAVMPALRRTDDTTFTTVMNQINAVIVNPVFVVVFLGAPVVAVGLVVLDPSPLVIVAAVLAVAGLIVTFAANIPLNEALADGGTREAFETPWVRWHLARTAACVASFALLCVHDG
jgi:uncharacterized membrane protein